MEKTDFDTCHRPSFLILGFFDALYKVWKCREQIHNPNFNYGEFAIIRSNSGLNSYKISVKEWTEKTNAIGIFAKAGIYGGTYAYRDIAFEFGMWISMERFRRNAPKIHRKSRITIGKAVFVDAKSI